ncbi:MAG: hypothetical protein KF861_22895, partial [Planctomycetaceae bacterium]|nr:hypothetical protein [Planctomycetaceae bacterium]
MSEVEALLGRIDAQIDAAKQRVEEFQQEKLAAYKQRQERLESFGNTCDQLADIWRPRLEALSKRLGERVNVSPRITPSLRQAVFHVQSPFARIVMTFSATTDD